MNYLNYSRIKWGMVKDAREFGFDWHSTGINPRVNIWGAGARRLGGIGSVNAQVHVTQG